MIREAQPDAPGSAPGAAATPATATPPPGRDISTKEMDDALRSCMGNKRSFILVLLARDAAGALTGHADIILGKTNPVEAMEVLLGCAARQHAIVVDAYEEALRDAARGVAKEG